MSEEKDGPIEDSKPEKLTPEEAYDKVAAEHGVDENGDEIVIDDDEPAIVEEAAEDPDVPRETSEEVDEPAVAAETSDDPLVAPHTWKPEWKENFNKITDPDMKKAILEQNQNMNRGFTERMTELATIKRDLMGVSQAVQPHTERLQRAGISPDVAIQRSLAWDAHIQQNPQQGILDMAKAYGVDLGQVTQQGNQEYLTPAERRLQEQAQMANQSVQQVQQQMEQWQQHQQQQEFAARQANAHQVLDEFIHAKDETGNPKHPYVEHVAPLMTQIIQSQMAPDLETAYRMAEQWSPDIQQAREQARKAEQVKAAKEKAEKVRKASGGIVGKPGSKGSSSRTMEQQIEATYNKIANA